MVQRILSSKPFEDKVATFAKAWADVSERFLASFWRCLDGMKVPPGADFELREQQFPYSDHWAVCRALMAHAEAGFCPTADSVRSAAEVVGYLPDTDDRYDLIRRIQYLESGAAGVRNYGAALIDFYRRRFLYDLHGRCQHEALDQFERVGDITQRVLQDLRDFQRDRTSIPKPLRLTRWPVIVIRPRSVAASPRGPARLRRRRRPSR